MGARMTSWPAFQTRRASGSMRTAPLISVAGRSGVPLRIRARSRAVSSVNANGLTT